MRDAGRERRNESLDYMQAILGELRLMAKADRHYLLAYLIEMAYLEASDMVRQQRAHEVMPDSEGQFDQEQ